MTATRPVWRPAPLTVLIPLRDAQCRALLRLLVATGGPPAPRRRVSARTAAAGVGAALGVLAVIALYVLLLGRLGMSLGGAPFTG